MGSGLELGFWQARVGRARWLPGLLLLASLAALAAGDFAYSTASGGVTITGYTGHGSSVVIPSTLNRRPVTAIGAGAFSSHTNLLYVTIPESVTSIGDAAFWGCTSLTGVTIPDSVTTLGVQAFGSCITLRYLVLSNRLTGIEDSTFVNCPFLTRVTIPDSVTHIGYGAFQICYGLTHVTVGKSVTSIGDAAFSDDSSLTSICFRGNAPSVGRAAFASLGQPTVHYLSGSTGWGPTCGGRPTTLWDEAVPCAYTIVDGTVTVNDYLGPGGAVTIPGMIDGFPVTRIGESAFYACNTVNSVTLPDSVTRIGDSAFAGCYLLWTATLGNGVTMVGDEAFAYCPSLSRVDVAGDAPAVGRDVFIGCDLANVYRRPGTTGWGAAFGGRPTLLHEPSVPCDAALTDGTVTIARYTGSGGAVTIPATIDGFPVTRIGENAFLSCGNVTSVAIPSRVTSIGAMAFYFCTALLAVTVEGNAPSVGLDVFLYTENATIYYLPGTTGWGAALGGRPTKQHSPLLALARVEAADVAAGRGLSDLSGSCTTTVRGNPLAMNLVHDTRGRLAGTATLQINTGKARVPLNLSVKGSARGRGGTLLVTLMLKGRDTARSVSATLSFDLSLSVTERRLSGPVTGSIEVNGIPARIAEIATLDLPPSMDGTWTLEFDLDQEGRNVTGTALLKLSNDVQHAFIVNGKKGANNTAILTLSGDPRDPASKAITIKTTLTPLEGGWARLESFSGTGYGQTIGW